MSNDTHIGGENYDTTISNCKNHKHDSKGGCCGKHKHEGGCGCGHSHNNAGNSEHQGCGH